MYGNNFISRFRAAFRQADPSTVLSVHKALRFVDRLGSAPRVGSRGPKGYPLVDRKYFNARDLKGYPLDRKYFNTRDLKGYTLAIS